MNEDEDVKDSINVDCLADEISIWKDFKETKTASNISELWKLLNLGLLYSARHCNGKSVAAAI